MLFNFNYLKDKKMKYLMLLLLVSLSSAVYGEELIVDKKYRTMVDFIVKDNADKGFTVGAKSKFKVMNIMDDDTYAIKFTNLYQYTDAQNTGVDSPLSFNHTYFVAKKDSADIPLNSIVELSLAGIVSGPLVVPFKYRLDDKSTSGEATVGYYAGYCFDIPLGDDYVCLSPFLAAGITQVSVSSMQNGELKSDSKSGISWATGFLIQNWDSVNIGVVYGQDRIGDSTWQHEGEGWISISIGWDI
jgi:hypothetical protein